MIKKIWIVTAILISILFTGCGTSYEEVKIKATENDINSGYEKLVEVYIENAQKLMDSGEYEAAKTVLEEGIKSTNNDTLADMLSEILLQKSAFQNEDEEKADLLIEVNENDSSATPDIKANEQIANSDDVYKTAKTSIVDYWDYTGIWATQDIGWEFGGVLLDVIIENDVMWIQCKIAQAYPQSRISVIEKGYITIDDITDDTLLIPFDDDGWGNRGTLQIEFVKNGTANTINCTISDVEYVGSSLPVWGNYDGEYALVLNWSAKRALEIPENMLENDILNPEEEDIIYSEAEFDIIYSTASEYLAYINMTEEEFKANSNTLVSYNQDFEYVNKTGKMLYTCENIESYPNEYVGMSFHYCVTGEKNYYYDESGELKGDLLSVKPASIIIEAKESSKDENGKILTVYQLNPVYYNEKDTILFLGVDSRDDVYAPKISEGNLITECYMVFLGVEPMDKYDTYIFKLISFELQ